MANDASEVGYIHEKTGTVTWIPSAHSIEVGGCNDPNCGHLHLFLMDQMQQPIAEATITKEFVDQLVGWWKNRS